MDAGRAGAAPKQRGGGGELARAPRNRRCPRVRYSAFLGFHHADQPAMAPALPHAVQLPCHAATTDRFDAFRGTARPPLSSHVSPRLRHSPAAPLLTPRPPPPPSPSSPFPSLPALLLPLERLFGLTAVPILRELLIFPDAFDDGR